eukprot:TRINITY_DN756_c0_g1_i1.p1 TRINITY_DN756_c0_g1~~TRINITY_DN756_c0_g1_i1.p1  ORF type:complete len:189 (+),score=35.45 TRINITY_DN756_c0_g1_i1:91-657(+)
MTTVEQVLSLRKPTDTYLCSLRANTYGIDFQSFTIRDLDHKKVIFEVRRDPKDPSISSEEFLSSIPPGFDENIIRCIRYDFDASLLTAKNVGTTLEFSVGPKPVKNFRMIERHYFREKLIKSFDFTFPFCIPNSTNTWEAIYEVPSLSSRDIEEIVAHPYETRSDSFYFVDGELIMHNKAEYAYVKSQ